MNSLPGGHGFSSDWSPAARALSTSIRFSPTNMQRSGETPICSAALRKIAGSGLSRPSSWLVNTWSASMKSPIRTMRSPPFSDSTHSTTIERPWSALTSSGRFVITPMVSPASFMELRSFSVLGL